MGIKLVEVRVLSSAFPTGIHLAGGLIDFGSLALFVSAVSHKQGAVARSCFEQSPGLALGGVPVARAYAWGADWAGAAGCVRLGVGANLGTCALCGRAGIEVTQHHLVPRMAHRQTRVRRKFGREERQETAALCRPCHRNVHNVLSEKELADHYHTLAKLAAHPEVAKFTAWIATKPADLRVSFRKQRRG